MLGKRNIIASGFLFFLFAIQPVLAHCPLCVAATGAAVATSRWLGVDDIITGIFIGGMIISTSLWFNNILKKGNKSKEYIKFQSTLIFLVTLISVITGFHFLDIIGPKNYFKLFGLDKILIGTFTGIAVSILGLKFHDFLRKINNNKNYIPLQSIVILLLFLILASVNFYIIGWAI